MCFAWRACVSRKHCGTSPYLRCSSQLLTSTSYLLLLCLSVCFERASYRFAKEGTRRKGIEYVHTIQVGELGSLNLA